MNIDAEALVKIGVAFTGIGVGIAGAKPFAMKLFERWLANQDRRDAALEKRDAAIDKMVETNQRTNERTIGVMERMDERQERMDQRLDRLEAHLRVPVVTVAKSIPPADPRKSITDEK